jgi:uncharacterized protein YbjT (DUF2867 family)
MDPTDSNMEFARQARFTPVMTNPTVLILGGSGKTGRRVASGVRAAGATARTAARHGADVTFDWQEVATYGPALEGAEAAYLVTQGLRPGHAREVATFLDLAEAAGVRHVTQLSARGVEQAPPEVTHRAIELDLAARNGLTHSILRPNWFMQNFSESFFQPSIAADGVIPAPTGDGAEAFVHVEDIAEVAVATLLDPNAHAGAQYALSGPEALTLAQVAERIAAATGRVITHLDLPIQDWVDQNVAAGMPRDYAELHIVLFAALEAGQGATTTDHVQRVIGRLPRSFDDYAAQPEARARWARLAA